MLPTWKASQVVHRSSPHRSPEPGKLIPMPSSHHRSAMPRIYMAPTAGYQPQEPDVVILAESDTTDVRISQHNGSLELLQPGYFSEEQYKTQTRGCFKNTYELLNLRALKFSPVNKIYIFQCMGKIFCVEFQRYTLKFHTKYLTHTLKNTIFIQHWNFNSS